jgi:DNA repair protein RecO (recombination protein O)
MSDSIEGLFLRSTKYAENSLIVDLLTAFQGKRTFLFKGFKKKKTSFVFQPFHVIEFNCKFNPDKNINLGYSPELSFPVYDIISDIRKTGNALFLTELLYKVILKNEPSEKMLFHLKKIILLFEHQNFNASFALFFMKEILSQIGIQPINNFSSINNCFNIENGRFLTNKDSDKVIAFPNQLLSKLLGMNIDGYQTMKIKLQDRNLIMSLLLDYFNYHAHIDKSEIKSLKIIYSLYD